MAHVKNALATSNLNFHNNMLNSQKWTETYHPDYLKCKN